MLPEQKPAEVTTGPPEPASGQMSKDDLSDVQSKLDAAFAADDGADDNLTIESEAPPAESGQGSDTGPEIDARAEETSKGPVVPVPATTDGQVVPDAGLLDRAERFGIDRAYAERLAKANLLEQAVIERADLDMRLAQQRAQEAAPKPPDTPAEPDKPLYELLDPAEFDERLINWAKGVETKYGSELKSLRDQNAQLMQVNSARQQAAVQSEYLDAVSELPDDLRSILADGDSVPVTGHKVQLHEQIIERMAMEAQMHAMAGRQPPPVKELFGVAFRTVCGQQIESAIRNQLSTQLDTRKGQHIARAGATKSGPGRGASKYDDAVSAVQAILDRAGEGDGD